MAHQNGEGLDHRSDGVEARELEQLGRRLKVLPTADKSLRQVRIVVTLTASRRKWRATLDRRTLCTSASPLVTSARVLIAQGIDPSCIIEMWHAGANVWALRGRLAVVAATLIDGETASRCAKNGSPVGFSGTAAKPPPPRLGPRHERRGGGIMTERRQLPNRRNSETFDIEVGCDAAIIAYALSRNSNGTASGIIDAVLDKITDKATP